MVNKSNCVIAVLGDCLYLCLVLIRALYCCGKCGPGVMYRVEMYISYYRICHRRRRSAQPSTTRRIIPLLPAQPPQSRDEAGIKACR